MRTLLLFWVFCIANAFSSQAQTVVEWRLSERAHGITQEGFAQVITDARNHFRTNPNDTLIIKIDAGTYEIGNNGSIGIDLNGGMRPGPNGRLIFEGAGMEETKLVFTNMTADMVSGRRLFRLEFRGIHFTRPRPTTTQGILVSMTPGEMVLDIQEGFPTPIEVHGFKGYLKKCTNDVTNPLLVHEESRQIPFGNRDNALIYPEHLGGNRWKIFLNSTTYDASRAGYEIGDLVVSRCKFDGNAFRNAVEGDDIVFRNVKWTHTTRIAMLAATNSKIIGCRIETVPINGQTPCLGSTAGGPQMYKDGSIVEDFFCDSTGDDAIAIYDSNDATVKNVHLRNALGRLYLYNDAHNVCLNNITLDNIPLTAWIVDPGETRARQEYTYDPNDQDFYDAVERREPGKIVFDCDDETLSIDTKEKVEDGNTIKYYFDNNNLTIQSEESIQDVKLFDISAKLLIQKQNLNNNSIQLNTAVLPQGLYILNIKTQNNIINKKILFNSQF